MYNKDTHLDSARKLDRTLSTLAGVALEDRDEIILKFGKVSADLENEYVSVTLRGTLEEEYAYVSISQDYVLDGNAHNSDAAEIVLYVLHGLAQRGTISGEAYATAVHKLTRSFIPID